ncbi:methyltransferase domain-containing protein [Sphaerimonospora cavernae]|uniref:Methyltransferase domain-containing protein n=1 Tax=Sphaerimonospora cavernae TaxID=1740611 RepID=A0ABV6U5X6_9ACTN
MSVDSTYATGADTSVRTLVGEFAGAPPASLQAAYRRLVAAVWEDGRPTELAPQAVGELMPYLDLVGDDRVGRLLVLLGLLAEGDDRVRAAVRQGLDRYLDLLNRADPRGPRGQALLYLLAHFPEDRDRILAEVAPLGLEEDDLSRLDRCLRTLDLDDPDVGRVWPAPSIWRLTDEERDFDRAWIRTLSPEQVAVNWRNDTRTVWGYMGAKAYWAVCEGMPVTVGDPAFSAEPAAGSGDTPAGSGAGLFGAHAAALRCPSCRGPLNFRPDGVGCGGCAVTYPVTRGILDLTEGTSDAAGAADQATADLLRKLAEMPSMGLYYEALLRPEFLRVAGTNWGGAVTPADEDDYIARHVRPVDGPVLDLAAGAGRWTSVIADTVGAERLIALDMGLPMLSVLRRRLPEIPAVRASALSLPFDDESLGAVVCWNALQAFPDDAAAAVAEIGRCLRPGGTFTMMTYVWDSDPVNRHFQASHYFPSRPAGMLLFEADEIRRWLADAKMIVREQSGPGTFLFVTAERVG